MEYRISITFAELGSSDDLTDRLLTVLLGEMPQVGPVISRDVSTGEMTVTVAVTSTQPTQAALHVTDRLDDALTRVGAWRDRTVLDVHIEAVLDDDGIADSAAPTLQPA
jgi:hypothetical protein